MRPRSFRRFAATIAATIGLVLVGNLASAADAKPKKKDTAPKNQPTQVTFESNVTPAKAKPGDVVTYSVTISIDTGWHLYGYVKAQPKSGPIGTQFDFFDPAGLKLSGEWTPDPKPEVHVDPNFDNQKVSQHEGKVTFSTKITIPSDAKTGKKVLRNQIYIQTCDEKQCLPPARVTVPDAELTIIGGSTFAPPSRDGLIASMLVATIPSEAADAKPKKKDSRPKDQPKEVKFETKVTPAKAKPGDVVTYSVTASMNKGWHIYGYVKEQPEIGPIHTQFDFFDPSGLKLSDLWTADPKPAMHVEAVFNNMNLAQHEGKVTFSTKITIPKDAKPGAKILRSQVYFQICDAKSCLPPTRVTVPDAELTIIGGSTFAPPSLRGMIASMLVAVPSDAKIETAAKPVATSETKSSKDGLISLLVKSIGGGLFAILMPCVWPMIPITVNFFVKEGEKKKGATTGLAIAYSLAIIGIFTGIGLGVTLLMGDQGASKLGSNAWLNLLMGVAFIALGASLLGLFEIRLPSAFVNFSSKNEGRGGLIGVMFMAMTLTITSFTCTAPVVGALLGDAARGARIYPLIGMIAFSSVLALPFFVLALMPSMMKKMPRSGDWMNAVKTVGGLIEIGAAFKFLNTAEISFGTAPDRAFFNASFVLTAWVVVAGVCGVYLLGLFRTDHDHDAIKVGPLRMLIGMSFLAAALFLAPALFGIRPQNKLYDGIVGILPPDAGELTRAVGMTQTSSPADAGSTRTTEILAIQGPVKAVSKDPKVAILEEKKFHGVVWGLSYEAAVAESKKTNRPILIDFTGLICTNCRTVEGSIMPRPEVVAELKKFVTVALYNDFVDIASITGDQREELADENKDIQRKFTGGSLATPTYVVITPDEKLVGKVDYSPSDSDFLLKFLKEMQAQYKPIEKVVTR